METLSIEKFFKKYKTDLPLFSSRVRWAGTKLGEVIVSTREEKLPCRARTVVSSDLLLAIPDEIDFALCCPKKAKRTCPAIFCLLEAQEKVKGKGNRKFCVI